ncbi:ribonuclease H1 domain-containing protein [Robiginitalea aurantiaca]|uniref:Ribonuclease H n=1 Tax=Robiginitalea aurantiaca TaxID=3056915 RepID=A0ABT7WE77_9FLAO|nr:viroplasmin family protein [Robiginitalea aurantiaca]MDM9631222.1 viroplasmin family protein [Robiginitalea aurantiaca]
MAQKKAYYTVWKGKNPGVYKGWQACKKEVEGFEGAKYMGFITRDEAEKAFNTSYEDSLKLIAKKKKGSKELMKDIGPPNYLSISVDAASSGNPGIMEYQGVDTKTGKKLFRQGPFEEGTNNIGEFLAIVHGLAYLKKHGSNRVLYSDSRTAMAWVRKKKCNTQLKPSEKNAALFEMIHRAEEWLHSNSYNTPVVKWETRAWGEIPADFGRK